MTRAGAGTCAGPGCTLEGVRRVAPLPTLTGVVVSFASRHVVPVIVACVMALPLAAQVVPPPTREPDYVIGVPARRFAMRLGADQPLQASDIWSFSRAQYTLERGDMRAIPVALELGFSIGRRLELVLGAGTSRGSADTEYRDLVGTDDLPIRQSTALRRTPLLVGVRHDLVAAGRRIGTVAWLPARVVPWVGAGGGALVWSFRQRGEFVEAGGTDILEATFADRGVTPTVYGAAGVDIVLDGRTSLVVDARYSWARSALGGDFRGFDRIDLAGVALSAGLGIRF